MSKRKITNLITSIVCILLILLAVGLVGKYAKDFSFEDYFNKVITDKSFSVSINDNKLSNEELLLESDVAYKFDINNITVEGYSVGIFPNATKNDNFDFYRNEQLDTFNALSDLSVGFDLKIEENSFILKIPVKYRVAQILRAVLPNEKISGIPTELSTIDKAMFKIVVTNKSDNKQIIIPIKFLTIPEIEVIDVKLDKETILF